MFSLLNLSKQVLYIYGICSKEHRAIVLIFCGLGFRYGFQLEIFPSMCDHLLEGPLSLRMRTLQINLWGCEVTPSNKLTVKLERASWFNGTVESELFLLV